MGWRTKTKSIGGTCPDTTTIVPVAGRRPYRDWLVVECDFATGHSMYVLWDDYSAPTGTVGGGIVLQPGESICFSRKEMHYDGLISVLGFSGPAGYRGGEVYWERA